MHLFSGFLLCFSEVKLAKVAGNFSQKKLKKNPLGASARGLWCRRVPGQQGDSMQTQHQWEQDPQSQLCSSMREKACSKVGAVQLAATELRKVELRKAPAQPQVLKSEQLERLAGS